MIMKKLMMTVLCALVAVAMTGCGGSPKRVAEKFAKAVIDRDDDAIKYVFTGDKSIKEVKDYKKTLDEVGKKINDQKLEAEAVKEVISVGGDEELVGYTVINGAKITGDKARVVVQFVKGKDLQDNGMVIELIKVDGSWKVKDYDRVNALCTETK